MENQFHLTTTESSDNNANDDFYTESTMITDSTINPFSEKVTEDETTQTYSSSMLVEVDIPSTLHASSLFELSSTNPIFSPASSQSLLALHSSLAQSSTTSTKLSRLLSSKYFSEITTTALTPPTTVSSTISTIETTDSVTTSDTTEQSSMTTFADESSSLSTSYPDDTSSFTDAISSESTSTEYVTPSTAIDSTTMFEPTTTSQTDEPSTVFFETTTEADKELTTSNSPPPETTSVLSTTDEGSTEYTSTETSSQITSTVFPDVYTSKIEYSTLVVTSPKPHSQRPSKRRTSASTTTTTIDLSRKQKITRPISSSLTTTTTTTTMTTASTDTSETTTFYPELSTSSPIYFWYPKFNSLQPQQQMIIIKPSLNPNSSNTLLSSELLQALFNSTNNSSNEKLIYFNLANLPPSSWNVSLHTNDSILLGIILPPPSKPLNFDSITNLSIINVDANRFSTSIVGIPINLQVDQIQTKQFSLAMNLTNDQINQSVSDVVMGHIKSEQFELNITKSDNINVHVHQVDSETAELYFDSKFCTNESNLQINLNLSKNGK
jgi:hypothetical protein